MVVIDGAPVSPGAPLTPSAPAAESPPSEAGGAAPLYAMHITQLDPEENYTSYILLSDTLDVASVDLSQAREFPGFASIAAVDGHLLVASATEPVVTSYSATPALGWVDGPSVSFAGYGARDAGFWNQFFLDDHTAYLTLDLTSRIIWDPTTLEIRGVMEDTNLQRQKDGFQLEPTVSRQWRPPVLRPFYYHDEDYFQWGASTPIAVYDRQTHAETSVIDAPCPAVEVESRDEAGNAYFSAWTFGPELGLYGDGPAQCVARVTADNTVDETWDPDLRSWVDGREVGVFRYMRDGKAIATVLEPELVQADFSGEYDPDVADALGGDVWRLWMFDLETRTARPIEGVGLMNRGFNWTKLDGRTFVLLPFDDWSKTRVYEVDTLGVAIERFEVGGSLYDWVRVR